MPPSAPTGSRNTVQSHFDSPGRTKFCRFVVLSPFDFPRAFNAQCTTSSACAVSPYQTHCTAKLSMSVGLPPIRRYCVRGVKHFMHCLPDELSIWVWVELRWVQLDRRARCVRGVRLPRARFLAGRTTISMNECLRAWI